MMANPRRGEVALSIDGKTRLLRLTLGALGALEAQSGAQNLQQLIQRFGDGEYKAADIILLLEAGLYGAGEEGVDFQIAAITGGAKAAAEAAMRLLIYGLGEGPP